MADVPQQALQGTQQGRTFLNYFSAEIRTRIYEDVFSEVHITTYDDHLPQLYLVNRQIQHEATAMYKQTPVTSVCNSSWGCVITMESMSLAQRRRVIHIKIDFASREHKPVERQDGTLMPALRDYDDAAFQTHMLQRQLGDTFGYFGYCPHASHQSWLVSSDRMAARSTRTSHVSAGLSSTQGTSGAGGTIATTREFVDVSVSFARKP